MAERKGWVAMRPEIRVVSSSLCAQKMSRGVSCDRGQTTCGCSVSVYISFSLLMKGLSLEPTLCLLPHEISTVCVTGGSLSMSLRYCLPFSSWPKACILAMPSFPLYDSNHPFLWPSLRQGVNR